MTDRSMYHEAGKLAIEIAEMQGKLRLPPKSFTSVGLNHRLGVAREPLLVMVGKQALDKVVRKLKRRLSN